jgi:para-aminobenzoate synthetase component 1
MPNGRRDAAIQSMIQPIPPPGNLAVLRRGVGRLPHAVMLESVAHSKTFGRYSIYAWSPARVIVGQSGGEGDPFDQLRTVTGPWLQTESDSELPFIGGWIGYLAYEAGRYAEPTASRAGGEAGPLPEWKWCLFDTALIHDRLRDQWFAAAVDLPAELAVENRPRAEERISELMSVAASATSEASSAPMTVRSGGSWCFSRESYLRKVERALEYIRDGDIFQVNLARMFEAELAADPIDVYQSLCDVNPAIYAAFIQVSETPNGDYPSAVISSSPELFLSLRGRRVTTRPIKGTRPRGRTENEDEAAAAELAGSQKDRAELNMIIDLERNDLGRVCEFGSVRVLEEGCIEMHPTVFHRTASITGTLRSDMDAIDLLRAAFPGGSVTGAPKVRAMQIIAEMEPQPRGAYCGAIGYIGLDGGMQLNLAIRTMTVAGGRARFHVGSGIVSDSDPEDEFRELAAKAAGMLRALGVDPDSAVDAEPGAVIHV